MKPEFFRDRKIGVMGPIPALVFEALWIIADDHGTAPCDPDRIKGELFYTWSEVGVPEITGALQELDEAGRITRFQVGDDAYCRIKNWKKHQNVHKPSNFRYPTEGEPLTEDTPEIPGTGAGDSGTPHLLDSKTPRLQDTKKKIVANKSQPTWLTPYAEVWERVLGGEPVYGQLAKELTGLHKEHGQEEVLAAWEVYLEDAQEKASPARFRSTYGKWTNGGPVAPSAQYDDIPQGFDDGDFFTG